MLNDSQYHFILASMSNKKVFPQPSLSAACCLELLVAQSGKSLRFGHVGVNILTELEFTLLNDPLHMRGHLVPSDVP